VTPTPSPTPAPLVLRVDPPSQNVAAGADATVNVVVDGAENLGAFQFTLEWNPSVVTYQSTAVGPFLGSTGRSVICNSPQVGVSEVTVLCNTLGSEPQGPYGSGVLASFTMRGLTTGLSPMHLTDVILADISAQLQPPAGVQDGNVIVTFPPTATATSPATNTPPPTNTPIATDTPVPTAGGSGAVAADAAEQLAGLQVQTTLDGQPVEVTDPRVEIQGTSVTKQPDAASIFLGDSPVTIYEMANNVPAGSGLGAYQVDVSFDPALVSVDVANDSFLGSTGRSVFCLRDDEPGHIRFSCVTSGSLPGATGSGPLARLTVQATADLELRPAPNNGIDVLLDDSDGETFISNTLGAPYALGGVGDANLRVRALEGDINVDCIVNVLDHQAIAGRFGLRNGNAQYSTFLDLEPNLQPDGDIDVNDIGVVYGRAGSTCADPWETDGPPHSKGTPTPPPTVLPANTPAASATPPASATPMPSPASGSTPTGSGVPTSTPPATATASPTLTPSATTPNTPPPAETSTPGLTPEVATETPGPSPTGAPTSIATETPTITPSPTLEPQASPVPSSEAPTLTPTLTPSSTPDQGVTPVPTDALGLLGDANCDKDLGSVDALLILQFVSRLIDDLCVGADADVDGNGFVDAVDAALVLQYIARLIDDLPGGGVAGGWAIVSTIERWLQSSFGSD
jgi:hypothetical protein